MIRLDHVTKRYPGGSVAVDDLTLEVGEGELCVLVGPSGCGKTTTMRMVNRLTDPSEGRISVGGTDIATVDPVELRRGIGYVIQQVGLFPHLTVAQNVATVPRLLGWNRARTASRTGELLELVGLDPGTFRDRYPDQLSGGQRQRVGVARALAADPPVLLMDEPFGAIDPVTRDRLQQEFLRLQAEVRKTVVFVTHDIDEAVRLGDRIAVFRQGGVLEQYATPADLLARPASAFVEDFVGTDRALKRLSVTAVDAADLEHPPTVDAATGLAEARRRMESDGVQTAVVVGSDGSLRGWIGRRHADGDGTVGERARRIAAWVEDDASLRAAFSEMLLHDAGWVAVLERTSNRYLGVLTPDGLHAALRRSIDAGQDHAGQDPAGQERPGEDRPGRERPGDGAVGAPGADGRDGATSRQAGVAPGAGPRAAGPPGR
ncbi:MAG: ABC transporter ATP-binding protein [Actinobacteria bacterium]|nr:ABC transporter ATP-binding protein [Actinomycetota bacterium]